MPDSPTHIRAADPEDIEQMIPLLADLFGIEADFQFDYDKQRRALHLLIREERSMVLVAEQDGRVIGMCSGQTVISTAEGGPALLVEDVVVAENCRGRGIGTGMLTRLGNWAKSKNISRLQLLADRNNNQALDFYLQNGWSATNLIGLRIYTDR